VKNPSRPSTNDAVAIPLVGAWPEPDLAGYSVAAGTLAGAGTITAPQYWQRADTAGFRF
jgi:hypothetical protein